MPDRPIYLDHHATTPTDPRVVEAMLPFFTESFGNAASRTHAFGWEAEKAVEKASDAAAPFMTGTDCAQEEAEANRAPIGSAAHLVLRAAEPWSPATHHLFPAAARARARELLWLGYGLSVQPRFRGEQASFFDVWQVYFLPWAVSRV